MRFWVFGVGVLLAFQAVAADFEAAPGTVVTRSDAALPWQKGEAEAPKPEKVSHKESAPEVKKPLAVRPVLPPDDGGGEGRDADDRRLSKIAADYYEVSPTQKDAVARYDALAKRVKDYLALLAGREYEVADFVKDAKSLQARIAVSRKKAVGTDDVAQKAVDAVSR